MTLELLYLPNCPHHREASDLVREVLKNEGIAAELTETPITDFRDATERSFPGSPTLRVNGQDIEDVPSNHLAVGFACRTYLVDGVAHGVPPRAWLERAVRAAHANEETRR
jgi:hypothetical protein